MQSLMIALDFIIGTCSFFLAGFVYAASVRPSVRVGIAPSRDHHNLNSTLVAVFLLGLSMVMFASTFSVSLAAQMGASFLAALSGVATIALFTTQMVRQWT